MHYYLKEIGIHPEHKKSAQAQKLAINKTSTILIQSK